MSEHEVLVVGGGIFGCQIAISLARRGVDTLLVEASDALMSHASSNNQNRLHNGLHYPRDLPTARQSLDGVQRFLDEYRSAVDLDVPANYLVSRQGSRVSAAHFASFAARLGIEMSALSVKELSELGVDPATIEAGWVCEEGIIDHARLYESVSMNLLDAGAQVQLNSRVVELHNSSDNWVASMESGELKQSRWVILATYASDTLELPGVQREVWEFQRTIIPIIRDTGNRQSITIMDGDFLSLLPYGREPASLVYSPSRSVVERHLGALVPPDWFPLPRTSTHQRNAVLARAREILPNRKLDRVVGQLTAIRPINPSTRATDERRSRTLQEAPRLLRIVSGKVDHAVALGEQLARRIAP